MYMLVDPWWVQLIDRVASTDLGGHESVRKWTSKLDIFQKKYIIVPINEKQVIRDLFPLLNLIDATAFTGTLLSYVIQSMC